MSVRNLQRELHMSVCNLQRKLYMSVRNLQREKQWRLKLQRQIKVKIWCTNDKFWHLSLAIRLKPKYLSRPFFTFSFWVYSNIKEEKLVGAANRSDVLWIYGPVDGCDEGTVTSEFDDLFVGLCTSWPALSDDFWSCNDIVIWWPWSRL